MSEQKITFEDDFREGFGFGVGFCAAASIYAIVWFILLWVFFTDMAKSLAP